jgi:PadR family transcriptional regulator AphA
MPHENRSKYAILGMLQFGPMSGYDIRKWAALSIAHFWKEDYGHIYPTLKLLLEEGLAERIEEAAPGRQPRHLYTITPAGELELNAWIERMPNPPNIRIELLLKVFLGSRAAPESLVPMLESQAEACAASLSELNRTERHLEEMIAGGGEEGRVARFQLMTLRYGKGYYEGLGGWCREVLEELRERP